MASRRIAHLSDLHIGAATDEATERLVRAVIRSGADRVAITGDVTHRGRAAELARFRRSFAPLLEDGRVVLVPGNHDRLGDDLEAELMPGERVQVSASHGTWIVRCNSTGPHNRRVWTATGCSPGPISRRSSRRWTWRQRERRGSCCCITTRFPCRKRT